MAEDPIHDYELYSVDEHLLRVDYPPGAEIDADQAHSVLADVAAMGPPRPILVDIRRLRVLTKGARQVFATQTDSSRVALLTESALSRALANFFVVVSQPTRPMKMFTDEADAMSWLRESDH